jgi:hypothetical protein
MPGARVGLSITTRCNAFGARRGCAFLHGDAANAAAGPRQSTPRPPTHPTGVWAADFQFDATTDGRPIKLLSIIDEHTRECLGGMVERCVAITDPNKLVLQ